MNFWTASQRNSIIFPFLSTFCFAPSVLDGPLGVRPIQDRASPAHMLVRQDTIIHYTLLNMTSRATLALVEKFSPGSLSVRVQQ